MMFGRDSDLAELSQISILPQLLFGPTQRDTHSIFPEILDSLQQQQDLGTLWRNSVREETSRQQSYQ